MLGYGGCSVNCKKAARLVSSGHLLEGIVLFRLY